MDWKNILYENLLILGFDYILVATKKSEKIDLFKIENRKAFQKIIMFIISKHELNTFEELSKLSLLVSDKRIQRDYLRKLHHWCMEFINKTFPTYTVSVTLFVSPVGSHVYELLARLTSCSLKWTISNVYDNSSTLRNPVTVSSLSKTHISPANILACLKEDFDQETKTYLQCLQTVVTRKQIFDDKIKELQDRIAKKKSLLSDIREEDMENHLSDETTVEKLEQVIDQCTKDLVSKMEKFKAVSEAIVDKFLSKTPTNRIEIPQSMKFKEKPNASLLCEGKLSLDRVIDMIASELSSDFPVQKNILIHREVERVKAGMVHISENIELQLNKAISLSNELRQLQTEINERCHRDTLEVDLKSFGCIPSVELLLESCTDSKTEEGKNHSAMKNQKKDDYESNIADLNCYIDHSSLNSELADASLGSFCSTMDDDSTVVSVAHSDYSDSSSLDPRYLIRTPVKSTKFSDRVRCEVQSPTYQRTGAESLSAFTTRVEVENSQNGLAKIIESLNLSHNSDGNFFEKSNDSFTECLYEDY